MDKIITSIDKNDIIDYLNACGFNFKTNINNIEIINKWNRQIYKTHRHEVFDCLSRYVDKYISEHIHEIITPELLNLSTTASMKLLGDTPNFNSDIDDSEHMWYNTFNIWNWNKFENGVIKIDERRI